MTHKRSDLDFHPSDGKVLVDSLNLLPWHNGETFKDPCKCVGISFIAQPTNTPVGQKVRSGGGW